MKAEIKLGSPSETSIVVDGKELTAMVGGIRVSRVDGAVAIAASPDTYPSLELSLVLTSASISIDGDVFINANPVTDEIGKAIYESLKSKYEPSA